MEPVIKSTQVALFYQPVYLLGSTINVPTLMREHFSQDIEITTYPIPLDVPAEIPRFDAKLGNLTFQFSNVRADIILTDGELTNEQLANFYQVILSFQTTLVRAGYVLKRSYENVNDIFIRQNLNLDDNRFIDLGEVAEANWRVNRVQIVGGGECNNISTLSLQSTDDQTNLLLERDVNTLQSRNNLNLSTQQDIETLITQIREEANIPFGIINNHA